MTTPLRISLVTPNRNGSAFLEKTIRSVLDQGFANLEYIVVDGDSTDESMAIIDKYRPSLSHVISEPDRGHTEAINKGFALATGDIMGWINSDDVLLPGSLNAISEVFQTFANVEWVTGRPTMMTEKDILHVRYVRLWSWLRFIGGDYRHIQQESTFWRRSIWQKAGAKLSTEYQLAADCELWTRFFRLANLYSLDILLGAFRFREGQLSRSFPEKYEAECSRAIEALRASIPTPALIPHIENLYEAHRLKPQTAADKLGALDNPTIAVDFRTVEFVMTSARKPAAPLPYVGHAATGTRFDGSAGFTWHEGPDFSKEPLVSLDAVLTSEVPAQADPSARTEQLPAMPMLMGPVAIYDLGAGHLHIQVATDSKPIFAKAQVNPGEPARVRVVTVSNKVLVTVNGVVAAFEDISSTTLVNIGPQAKLGSGFLSRHWIGRIEDLRVETRNGSSKVVYSYGRLPVTDPDRPHADDLRRFSLSHKNERCFVMGNGPSLNKMDLSKLRGETVFACNAAFLLFDRVDWRPKYYTCVDARVLRDRAADITAMLDENPEITAFFPYEIKLHDGSGKTFDTRTVIPPASNRFYFNEVRNSMDNPPDTMFSINANHRVVQPFTVSITMLQLAAYLGFNPIYLIGCDTSYVVPTTTKQEGRKIGEHGLLLTSTEDDDPNHFDPRYFGKGREWHNPQVEGMLEHHKWAKAALEPLGTEVINATIGGRLEVYPRIDFDSLFT